jgi:FkbM family methyltransferase
MQLLKKNRVDLILDVGANKGQYALAVRENGFKGKIVSFEPLQAAYAKLQENLGNDTLWKGYNFGLGDSNEFLTLNVASNLASSSFLSMNENHLEAAPSIYFSGKEKVEVKTIDSIWPDLLLGDANVLLKIDTQGFEINVLKGAVESLANRITGVQLEMSLTEVYGGEKTYLEIIDFLNNCGFRLYSVEPGLSNHTTGELLQMDGLFLKSNE